LQQSNCIALLSKNFHDSGVEIFFWLTIGVFIEMVLRSRT